MKKILQLTSILAILCLTALSCAREELDTDQYASDGRVLLQAYGPQPVVRGGTLRFLGSNLDKVKAVIIPEGNEITDIQVVASGMHSEIRVTVPKETSAPGYPQLKLADGTVITGKTELTYSEPISFDALAPVSVYPGDVITIKGEYLNLIHEVIFTKDVRISEDLFKSHSRYEIKVEVPETAETGTVGIGTVDEEKAEGDEDLLSTLNIIEFKTPLTIGTAKGTVKNTTAKAGDEITIEGDHLTLVKSVRVEGAEITTFKSATTSKLVFVLPAEAKDGDVVLVMASGVEVPAGSIATVKPSVSSTEPAPAVPGELMTIKGTDLDLVKSLEAPAVNADNSWPAFDLSEEGAISFTLPEDAKGDDIVLHLENGESVAVPYELLLPVIEAVEPGEIVAGDQFKVKGTALNQVAGVSIGSQACEFTIDSDTEITVTSDPKSVTGKVSLKLKSGNTVTSSENLIVKAAGVVQVTDLPESASVGDEITMTGSGFNAIEAIYFGDTKITAYSKRADDEMVFTIPVSLEAASYQPRFVLTTGEEELCAMTINVKGMTTVIVLFEGSHEMDQSWDGGKALYLGADAFAKVPLKGATLHIEYECTPADYNNMQLCYNISGWPKLGEYGLSSDSTSLTVELDSEAVRNMYQYGLVVFGYAWITHKVYITYDNQSYDPIFVSDIVLVDWDNHGGHNGYWDQPDGWGGVTTELVWVNDDELYLRVKEDATDQKWVVCCNHQSKYTENVPAWTIDDASKYVVKMDIMLEEGLSTFDGAAGMTFNPVLGDNWTGGKDAGLFPATTGGKWITVTIDLGLSGALDCSSGVNGFMAGGVPAGLCIDNYRLSLR